MIQEVFKPKRRINGVSTSARLYSGRYRLKGEKAIVQVALGTPDKQVAETLLAEIVKRRERERCGLTPSNEILKAAEAALSVHLKTFVRERELADCSPGYTRQLLGKITRLAKECHWAYARDISAASFSAWRVKQRSLCPKTLNEYQDAVSAFAEWLWKNQRCLTENPLSFVERLSTIGKETFHRRALSPAQIQALLDVAGSRKEIYQIAIYTALRRGELEKLLWGDVRLDSEKPHLSVRASTTKNKKMAAIRLHPVAEAAFKCLRQRQVRADASHLVFEGIMPTPDELRSDLVAAGIPNETANRVDFHSFRHTMATLLASRPDISPRTSMEVMRHSDMRLTMKTYTDASLLPTSTAILSLPSFESAEQLSQKDSQIHSQKSGAEGRAESQGVASPESIEGAEDLVNKGSTGVLSCLVALWREIENGARCRVRIRLFYRVIDSFMPLGNNWVTNSGVNPWQPSSPKAKASAVRLKS